MLNRLYRLIIKTHWNIITLFFILYRAAKEGKHEAEGYSNSAYGMSKVGVTVMTPIQQAAFDANRGGDDIIVNAVSV